MKTILFAILSIGLCLPAFAQRGGEPSYTAQSLSLPATIAASSITNVGTVTSPPVIDVRKAQNVAISFSFTMSASGASNAQYIFYRSVDGIYYDTNNPIVLSGPMSGTTQATISTNISAQGYGFFKLYSISNNHATATMTNNVSKYSVKLNAE